METKQVWASNGQVRGRLFKGDAYSFLRARKSGSASLIFLDPPFNLGKKYSENKPGLDSMPREVYEAWLRNVLTESIRVLARGGALYLYHLPIWAMRLSSTLDQHLHFRHWIAVSMKNGFVRGRRLYPAHYALLMFTKGEPSVFNRPRLPPRRCRACGEPVKDYGGYWPIIEKKGINLSDIWEDLSPVRHKATKNRPANELPRQLYDRLMYMSGSQGGLYLDPFAGSGSGVLAAISAGMRFAACDLLPENCSLIKRRIENARN